MTQKAIGVIPARLGSTRLQEKVLKLIEGRPMIQHVWERAKQTKALDDLIVACDDVRVMECVSGFGGKAVMTRADHPNGSSRVAEVANAQDAEIFINIQGDEPLIRPEGIDGLVEVLRADKELQVATLAVKRSLDSEYENPNVVKVVCDANGNALYFSRSPLPYVREKRNNETYLKHLGIYGYRKAFLLKFIDWPKGRLEESEKLEQLRILEQGVAIRIVETPHDSLSVDTAEDLELVESKLKTLGPS